MYIWVETELRRGNHNNNIARNLLLLPIVGWGTEASGAFVGRGRASLVPENNALWVKKALRHPAAEGKMVRGEQQGCLRVVFGPRSGSSNGGSAARSGKEPARDSEQLPASQQHNSP